MHKIMYIINLPFLPTLVLKTNTATGLLRDISNNKSDYIVNGVQAEHIHEV